MYRVTLSCEGLTEAEAVPAIADILKEFTHRPWHAAVTCTWNGKRLELRAVNDYDSNGSALLDEYWDVVHACINYSGAVRFSVLSVEEVEGA